MKILLALAAGCGLFWIATTASAAGDVDAGREKSAACAACHGTDGNSASAEWPKLAGQHAGYTAKQLRDYRSGARANDIMLGMSAGLSDEDIADLAAFYAAQTIEFGIADPELVLEGEALYRGGDSIRGIPACSGCHGPDGRGNSAANFPWLAGQHAEYTAEQLALYRTMVRNNDPNAMMRGVAANMTDQQIRAVAEFIQGLRP